MQDSGSLAVFKVTARDQGHYKGPSGHLLHTVTFLVILKICVKVGPYIIQCVCSVELMFGMIINIGPKFYSVPSPPMGVTYRSRSQALIVVCFVL